MAGAAWVTEEEGNGTSGSWGNVVRGKGWGGTSEGGGAAGARRCGRQSGTWGRGTKKQGARVTSILFDLELIICK